MKGLAFISILISISAFTNVEAQITFQKSYGITFGNSSVETNDVSVIQTYDGNYCVGGTINANNGDLFIMKINTSGDTLWTRTYGGNFDEMLYAMSQTSDSGFILAGKTRSFSAGNSDGYLVRVDKYGDVIWSKNYGGFDWEWFTSVQELDSNKFIVCGTTSTFGAGFQDVYLLQIDSIGNIEWTKTIGGSGLDRGCSVQSTFDNGFVITGYTTSFTATSGRIYMVKTDSAGNPLWTKILGGVMGEAGYAIRQCSDSGYVVTGYTNSFGAGSQDIFLLKTDIDGNLLWMKSYGGAWEDIGYCIEQTPDYGFIITGRTQSFGPGSGISRNIYLIKTDSLGDTLWTRAYGSVINNGYSAVRSSDAGYYIASSPSAIQIIKCDSLGRTPCNSYYTNTTINTITPASLNGAVTGTGGTAYTAGTLTPHAAISINDDCSSISVDPASDPIGIAKVFPNPFTDEVMIAGKEDREYELIIYNVLSHLILRVTFRGATVINTSLFESGSYIFQIETADGVTSCGILHKL